jgi:hypothetical protein
MTASGWPDSSRLAGGERRVPAALARLAEPFESWAIPPEHRADKTQSRDPRP